MNKRDWDREQMNKVERRYYDISSVPVGLDWHYISSVPVGLDWHYVGYVPGVGDEKDIWSADQARIVWYLTSEEYEAVKVRDETVSYDERADWLVKLVTDIKAERAERFDAAMKSLKVEL